MASSDLTRNLRDGVLTIKDETGTPLECELVLDEGDLSIEINQSAFEVQDRGSMDHVRAGDDQPMRVSFSMKYVSLGETYGAETYNPYEFLTGTGGASAVVTTAQTGGNYDLVDGGDVELYQLYFTINDPEVDNSGVETIEIPNFHVERISFQEGDEYSRLSVEGLSYQKKPIISYA